MNNCEIRRDEAAQKFFSECLDDGLRFKRANDVWISKPEFIASLKDNDPFESRQIEDIIVQELDAGHATVNCLVVCKKADDDGQYGYRNIRIFRQVGGKWLLNAWYNYEVK